MMLEASWLLNTNCPLRVRMANFVSPRISPATRPRSVGSMTSTVVTPANRPSRANGSPYVTISTSPAPLS